MTTSFMTLDESLTNLSDLSCEYEVRENKNALSIEFHLLDAESLIFP